MGVLAAMRFNLKNRPKTSETYNYAHEIEKWFEGFEAELRELLPKQIHPTVIQLIKEILGE